ncbi:hypothetical protein [Pseudobacteriovorax antillogorgiicola]|uniref:Signal transducing protein n=1 Tax=Pseudobacteriovorax antillogorgiicola TaxID=1513793 RepID=A0A1Y6BZI2_9BACT|nr:hypothetical protein [Pseudobacteriovorax antillogorgiicola]TCS53073.1 hypothetical protein EDD56_108124 [Pseudobacteriovorax antillogorgiicola]SMF26182.1 hypothetical protein SAMN06296036_108123 [Pseudobacteriovorax antillogorgiicola]
MVLQGVKIFRSEEEAILLNEHLTRSGVYSLYEAHGNKFILKVRAVEIDLAVNLISNCPMLKDLQKYKASKLGRVS